MSYHQGNAPGPDESAEQLLNRLSRPAFVTGNDVILNRSVYDVQPHPALSGEATTETISSLAVGPASYPGLLPSARTTDLDTSSLTTPERPMCTFFLRTGTCAYGDRCKFLHPRDRPPPVLNSRGYPVRPDEVDCAHYLKKGWCAFNLTCKFNHPELPPPVLPGSPYGLAATQPFINIPANNNNFTSPGAIYSLAPPAVPVMYYLPNPLGTTPLRSAGFQTTNLPSSNVALSGAYTAGATTTLAGANNIGLYRQQQQHLLVNAMAQQSQPPLMYPTGLQDAVLLQSASRADQLTNAMQKLRLGRTDMIRPPAMLSSMPTTAPQQHQQQAR